MSKNNAQLINQKRKEKEADHWQTPARFIEAARLTMGSIDLDPASCASANERVKAKYYFTEQDNGLTHQWFGNIWMNPPFSLNDKFMPYLVSEYKSGRVKQACVISFASTETEWYRCLVEYPICYLFPRVNYIKPLGIKESSGAPKASSVAYLGPDIARFAQVFGRYGYIMVPYSVTAKCDICGKGFVAGRTDARYCGPTCRQRARRQRTKE